MNMEKEIQQVLLDDIIPNRFQPRKYFDDQSLKELAESIKEHGIIQPLVLRKLGDKYEIIAGERRYKASIMAGRNNVPAIIVNLDDVKSAEIALAENVQRSDLSSIEEAESIQNILRISGMTQVELALKLGKSQAYIANKLRLLELIPDAKQALLENRISERHARSLLMLKDYDTQLMMLNNIINNRLTVRQTDDEIKNIIGANNPVVNKEEIEIIEDFGDQNMQTNNEFNNNSNDINLSEKSNQNISDSFQAPIIENNYLNNDLDVEKLKNESIDINQPKEIPSFDNLLKSDVSEIPVANNSYQANPATITNNPYQSNNRFIPSLEDEPASMLNDFVNQSIDSTGVTPLVNPEVVSQEFNSSINQQLNPMASNYQKESIPTYNINYGQEQVVNNSPDLRTAISLIRSNVSDINSKGYTVETDELDLDDVYQIIIKIKK